MARIGIGNVGKYVQSGNNGGYFSLKDDGDSATVRFLYNQPDGSDMDFYLVHEVEIDGKRRYVSCNAVDDAGEVHPDDCPLCKAGNKPKEKLFLQLIDATEPDSIKVWERGATFIQKIVTYLNRFGDLSAMPFDVVRRGKKGSKQTSYELIPLGADGKNLESEGLPQKRDLEGTLIVKATKQDMQDMIDGVFTLGDKKEPQQRANNYTGGAADFAPRARGTREMAQGSDVF